jgi:hypothetical protein
MPFIGNQPALAYTSFAVQHFTTSATTSYTLDYPVANENEIRLVINNVVQQPGSSYAYSATGTSLTLTSATTATDTMYAVFLGKAVQTVNPPASSITNSMIASNAAIALTKLASTGTLTVDNIQFPATAVASADANNLDDYEEGTWTPILGGEGTNTGQTYTSQSGRYTKIGNRVYVSGYVKLSAVGTLGGAYAAIKNFPFTASASVSFNGGLNFTYALNFASNIQSLGAYINTDNVGYICGAATTGTNVLPNLLKAVIGSTTEVAFIGHYIV